MQIIERRKSKEEEEVTWHDWTRGSHLSTRKLVSCEVRMSQKVEIEVGSDNFQLHGSQEPTSDWKLFCVANDSTLKLK